jgi:hypothetical protein
MNTNKFGLMLDRDEAVAIVGEDTVKKVEGKNCEPTGRCGYNGLCQDDDEIEWTATVTFDYTDDDGDEWDGTITAFYFTDNEDEKIMSENSGDGASITWKVAYFVIN